MKLFLGLDSGNTKTLALVSDETGTIRGSGRGGPGDIYLEAGGTPVAENWQTAISEALSSAGANPNDIAAVAFNAAGADWEEDYAEITRRARALFPATNAIAVYNDVMGAIIGGCPEGWGVGISAGTYLAVGSRNEDREFWHASFWIETGGAAQLGVEAWSAVKRAELGMSPPTTLTGVILDFLNAANVTEILHRQTRRDKSEHIAWQRLAPKVIHAAEMGDDVALTIVNRAGNQLGEWAACAARRASFAPHEYPVSLAGGLFHHPSPLIEAACAQTLEQLHPCASIGRSNLEPVGSAVLLALEADGIKLTSALSNAVKTSLPPPAFFETESQNDA